MPAAARQAVIARSSVDRYLLPIVAVVVAVSLPPVAVELRRSRRPEAV